MADRPRSPGYRAEKNSTPLRMQAHQHGAGISREAAASAVAFRIGSGITDSHGDRPAPFPVRRLWNNSLLGYV